jgi:predicted transcriptional regulator
MTQTATVLNALMAGEELTAKQIAARYSVGNPYEVVRQLRENGHAIYLNKRKDSKGRVTHKYRLGTPSRAMVASAYALFGNSAFE